MISLSLSHYQQKVLIVMGLVILLGLLSRLMPIELLLWDKYLGDALYAAVFYLALSFLWPGGNVSFKAILTGIYVVSVEAFQLTPIPAQLNRSDILAIKLFAYLVLGSAFSGWDLLTYGAGIVTLASLDYLYLKGETSNP